MGAYLSQPVTEKELYEGRVRSVDYGGAAMQGWRRTMEDAHLAVSLGEKGDAVLFGVFDGHGGSAVAKFCEKHMAEELERTPAFQEGRIGDALVDVFHQMDEMMRQDHHAKELDEFRTRSGSQEEKAEDGADSGATSQAEALDLLKKVLALKKMYGDGEKSEDEEGGADTSPTLESLEEEALPEHNVQAGCTAVVAVAQGRELYVANAGDSRAVLCRDGKAVALSEDHKPASEIERSRIVAAGGFLSEIGGVCRVNGNLNLSRAIGDLKYKGNQQLAAKDQIITAHPDIRHMTLQPEDRFLLLACDGVWDVMDNQEAVDFISRRLDQGQKPAEVAAALLDNCLASDPKETRGLGCDNMTATIVLVDGRA